MVMLHIIKDEIWPVYDLLDDKDAEQRAMTFPVDIPFALYEEYKKVMGDFYKVQNRLEQYYDEATFA